MVRLIQQELSCHTEMLLTEKEQTVPKLEEEAAQKTKISQKKQKIMARESILHKINANNSKKKKVFRFPTLQTKHCLQNSERMFLT